MSDDEFIKAGEMIFPTIMQIPDEYERWRTLVCKYGKFAMQFPSVAISMSFGQYNSEAFRMFLRKLRGCKKQEMTNDDFCELHAHYMKYLYMKQTPHYDVSKLPQIMEGGIKTMRFLFKPEEKTDNLNEMIDSVGLDS